MIQFLKYFMHSLIRLSVVQKMSTKASLAYCSSLHLRFEIANHVLAQHTGAITHEDGLPCDENNLGNFFRKRCCFK